MSRIATAVLLLLLTITSAIADPVGRYTAYGTNPGDHSKYTGTVSVERTGETYRVVWVVEGARYIGTGIGDDNFLAVTYTSTNSTGLALYSQDGAGWRGVWTYAGSDQIGTERWERK